MAIAKQLVVINDFSSGEVDADLKRGATSATATGGRQMLNWRVLNSAKKANRSGRSVLFLETGRVDELLLSPGNTFFVAFGAGYLRVYNAAGTQVFSSTKKGDGLTPIPWTLATVADIVAVPGAGTILSIFIFYADGAPNNVPQVLTWDGVSQTSTWTLTTYAETVTAGDQKRTMFYRISPQNVTLQPSAITGDIDITFSEAILYAGMVGTRMTYCGRQILITACTESDFATGVAGPSQYGTATVEEDLPAGQELQTGDSGQGLQFQVGTEIIGSSSGAVGIVTQTASDDVYVQLLPDASGAIPTFTTSDTIVGSQGVVAIAATSAQNPQAVSVWADEVMNTYRGYPKSGFFDQSRLGLCNFPSVPSAIGWSAIGLPYDFYVATNGTEAVTADDAIFELAPGKSQVRFVLPGMESSEFVFCDNAVYYIPISQSLPLEPGSVAFNLLSEEGCYTVQPRAMEQSILFVGPGGLDMRAVEAPGAYYRPYVVSMVSEFHTHLFSASLPISIAVPSASTQFQELYAYVLLANGTLVIGRYSFRQGLLDVGQEGKPKIGWLPWNGGGTVSWISALGSDMIFTTAYAPNGIAAVSVVEKLDNTQYLDAAISVNSPPAALAAPSGKGPLWWIAGGTVFLIDLGTRFMGTYTIDANGWIIPQDQGGENLLSSQLIAGQPWTGVFEPFIPDAGAGQDARQRTRRRKIVRAAVSVENSSGFVYAASRVPAYFVGDNAALAAPLREDTYRFRYPGRFFDPRVVLQKDAPGPLTVLEHAIEATV